MKARIYIGIRLGGVREVIRATAEPTERSHGAKFICAIGPFDTMRAARFMRDYGRGNPHCLTVADAEQLARRAA